MKDTVVIKVYRNDIACSEYHDVYLNDFNAKVNELKSYANQIGKKIYFTVCHALDCADFDCFAEVSYSGILSEQEKEKYISIIKFFAKDANIERNTLNVYDLPISIIFTKAQMDIGQ